MDKDRDISRSVTTITPKKVGLVGSALLAGSALVAACGGGAKSATTPEGGVGGAQYNPTTGSSIEMKTVIASPTAKVEAPTVAPTATAEAQLTQEQAEQVASQVDVLITGGLSNPELTKISISQAGGDGRYLDPEYTKKAIANCDISRYGQPIFAVNLSRTVQPNDPDYSNLFLINCAQPADVAKSGFKATGDQRFQDASEAWKAVHKRAFDFVKGKDPKLTAPWSAVISRYYIIPQS